MVHLGLRNNILKSLQYAADSFSSFRRYLWHLRLQINNVNELYLLLYSYERRRECKIYP